MLTHNKTSITEKEAAGAEEACISLKASHSELSTDEYSLQYCVLGQGHITFIPAKTTHTVH